MICDRFPIKFLSCIASSIAFCRSLFVGFIILDLIGSEKEIVISFFQSLKVPIGLYLVLLIDCSFSTEPKNVYRGDIVVIS